jgi:hypothetical protein
LPAEIAKVYVDIQAVQRMRRDRPRRNLSSRHVFLAKRIIEE